MSTVRTRALLLVLIVLAAALAWRLQPRVEPLPATSVAPTPPAAAVGSAGAPVAAGAAAARPERATALAGFLDAKAVDRLPPDFEERVPAVRDAADVEAVIALLRNRDEPEVLRNEAANLLRRSGHPGLPALLLAILDDGEEGERFRGYAVQHLGLALTEPATDQEAVRARLREALTDRHLDVRRETLLALERAGDTAATEAIARGLRPDATADLRDLVIRAVLRAGRQDLVADIRPYLADKDGPTRIAAIHALGQFRDADSRDAFIAALRDPDPRVARAAELALATLATPAAP